MEKVVLFSKPIWLAIEDDENTSPIKNIIEILGYRIQPGTDFDKKAIDDYLDYLCGLSQWQQDGNINDYCFYYKRKPDGDYDRYSITDPEIVSYNVKARKIKNLTHQIYKTNKPLGESTYGMLNTFILSRDLYDNIKEYGAKL